MDTAASRFFHKAGSSVGVTRAHGSLLQGGENRLPVTGVLGVEVLVGLEVAW